MTHIAIEFPMTMYDAVFGTEEKPPTVPAPEGGWGVPNMERTKAYFSFGLPLESLTPELVEWCKKNPSVLLLKRDESDFKLAVHSDVDKWNDSAISRYGGTINRESK